MEGFVTNIWKEMNSSPLNCDLMKIYEVDLFSSLIYIFI